jgi:hypothetical protein
MVGIQIKQTTTAPSYVPCFWMPIEIKLKTDKGDRIIKLMNNTNSMTNFIYCDSTVTNIEIDPNNNILNDIDKITKDASIMNVNDVLLKKITVSPNPTKDSWLVSNLPANTTLQLMDISGKLLWQQNCSSTTIIPADILVKGVYTLLATVNGSQTKYIRLIKY